MTDEVQAGIAAAPVAVIEPTDGNEPSFKERAAALVAAYELGMEHNAPRTKPELKELKALLLGE